MQADVPMQHSSHYEICIPKCEVINYSDYALKIIEKKKNKIQKILVKNDQAIFDLAYLYHYYIKKDKKIKRKTKQFFEVIINKFLDVADDANIVFSEFDQMKKEKK